MTDAVEISALSICPPAAALNRQWRNGKWMLAAHLSGDRHQPRLLLHRRTMAHEPRNWACRRLCSPVVIAWFLLHRGAVAGTDERERLQLPEPIAAAQTRESLLLIALTYPGAQQGRDRFSAALPELIQFYRKNTRLKMLEVQGRVVVIFSDLNFTWSWAYPKARYGPNSLRLGANLIVFATAQKIAGIPPKQP